jgi:hypothetical protein
MKARQGLRRKTERKRNKDKNRGKELREWESGDGEGREKGWR